MSTPRQVHADKIRNAAAKKREAVEALVTTRNTGEGPLFNEAQIETSAAVWAGVLAAGYRPRRIFGYMHHTN